MPPGLAIQDGRGGKKEDQNLKKQKKETNDAVEILHRRYVRGDAEKMGGLARIRADDAVARKIYDLRVKSGLSQRALAKLVGTSASAICRLEDADYEGHSLAMLTRIAEALDRRVEIRFIPIRSERSSPVHA
jgi:DNA-binding XRE family transcriptional regulator